MQETNVLIVHLIGAMLAFGIGTVYCWITSIMSYKMCPEVSSRVTCHVRIAICVFTSIAFIISILRRAMLTSAIFFIHCMSELCVSIHCMSKLSFNHVCHDHELCFHFILCLPLSSLSVYRSCSCLLTSCLLSV